MTGRFWEICRGINVDLGTSAAFRAQWDAEVAAARVVVEPPRSLVLANDQAPGDAVAMTAAVYSLHRAHPGRFRTAVRTRWREVWEHNPDLTPPEDGAAELQMHYPAIHKSNERAVHFMQGWCEHLGAALGVDVPLLTDRPHLYFSDPEPPLAGDYWVVCSGTKSDFTCKGWGRERYQRVVDEVWWRTGTRFVQVGGAGDDHPRLRGAEDMVGKTTLRQLFDLVRRARGVLCGVTLLMHVAAALDKPAVVVAGGREPVAWNAYPRQQYVHTVGALGCRDTQGRAGRACWRSRVVPLGDGTPHDRDPCERSEGGVPACMRLIRPAEVAAAVLRYDRQYGDAGRSFPVGPPA
jgi:hypothetical protein